MSFLGFGRRVDPGLDRQRQAVAHVSAEFAALEQQLAGLPELKASFASVWEDVPELGEVQTKMSSMRELISLLQSRAAAARSELSNFDEPITMVAREIGYGQGLLENLAVTLVTKRGLAASRE
jgi:hypothetical protein